MATFGPYVGVVDQVHDGDTVHVKLDVGFDLTVYARVRIAGVDAPELVTAEGKQSRDFAQTLLKPGDAVRVTTHGWDKFGGRVDGDVVFGAALDFAASMLAAGHAKPWTGKGAKP